MASAEPLAAAALTIADVAARAGLSAGTLRHDETANLISPAGRSARGRRRHAAGDLAGIELLLRLRDAGMPIAGPRPCTAACAVLQVAS